MGGGESNTLPGAYWCVIEAVPRLALGWGEEICANLLAYIDLPMPALIAQLLPDHIWQPGQPVPHPGPDSEGTALLSWTLSRHCGTCCSASRVGTDLSFGPSPEGSQCHLPQVLGQPRELQGDQKALPCTKRLGKGKLGWETPGSTILSP